VALLVVRVWRDTPDPSGFRARVWLTDEVSTRPLEPVLLADLDQLREVIDGWLLQLHRG
jgi:hypothetical protein